MASVLIQAAVNLVKNSINGAVYEGIYTTGKTVPVWDAYLQVLSNTTVIPEEVIVRARERGTDNLKMVSKSLEKSQEANDTALLESINWDGIDLDKAIWYAATYDVRATLITKIILDLGGNTLSDYLCQETGETEAHRLVISKWSEYMTSDNDDVKVIKTWVIYTIITTITEVLSLNRERNTLVWSPTGVNMYFQRIISRGLYDKFNLNFASKLLKLAVWSREFVSLNYTTENALDSEQLVTELVSKVTDLSARAMLIHVISLV